MKFEEVPSGSYLIKGNTVIDKEEWDMKFSKATLKVKVALDIIPLEDVEKNDRN